jgi:competence protein CoiA
MPLYAVDEDDLIHAGDASYGKTYWCADCFAPVKRRSGKNRLPHFYHLKTAPSCRLYSKTEDHLLAQVQIQKAFPEGVIQLERPFIQISRIADVCLEKEKVIFEIQCSPMSEKEAAMRIRDYRSIGYEVIWLLDDKRYNRRVIRPAEEYLRRQGSYYLRIERGLSSTIYDQFELFWENKRVKRGKKMELNLQDIRRRPNVFFNQELFPKQIAELKNKIYLLSDRTDRALKGSSLAMNYWRHLEMEQKRSKVKEWLQQNVIIPYLNWLQRVINRMH